MNVLLLEMKIEIQLTHISREGNVVVYCLANHASTKSPILPQHIFHFLFHFFNKGYVSSKNKFSS